MTLVDDIRAAADTQIAAEVAIRQTPPLTRIYDAEWALHYSSTDLPDGLSERKATWTWISNDTGPGRLELPFDTDAAQWIHDHAGRITRGEGRNVCVTVDYCGARWSGLMDKYAIEQREDGDTVLVIDFMHDYEHVKWVTVWSNPWLNAAFQAPRAWIAAGPADWVLKHALWVNIVRHHNPLITVPDDPLDLNSWFTSLDMSTWHMVVKPKSFLDCMASGTLWAIAFSRWSNWHDMARPILEDAQLLVTCTRYLEGDDPPWEGASLRYGTLVIDIIDKSDIYVGTSSGGNIFSGLARTLWTFTDDMLDSTIELAADTETPADYFKIGWKFTHPAMPYVIFREGENSAIQTSQLINSPAKGVAVATGGHSMPGVNELISATIQAGFDLVGGLALLSSLGSFVDSLVKPLYEDVVLAWWNLKNPLRAQQTGWERLDEFFQSTGGANKAYTVAALMVIRAGYWSTRTVISWKASVLDGYPWMVGDNGVGHFFLEDRVGLVLKGDTTINMDRVRKLELTYDDENPPTWEITVGDDRIWQDPAQRSWGRLEAIIAGLRDLGVWAILIVIATATTILTIIQPGTLPT